MAWTNLTFPFGSTLSSTQMTQLDDNFDAFANKDSGAPTLAAGYVTQTMMGSASVGQSQLKTSWGQVSANLGYGGTASQTLPGGEYGFFNRMNAQYFSYQFATYQYGCSVAGAWYTAILLQNNATSAQIVYAGHRYVTASPPYDLGDGEIGQFIFAVVDNATGSVEQVYAAPEAPWHNNGPTDIRADYYDANNRGWRKQPVRQVDYVADQITGLLVPKVSVIGYEQIEITQAIKQADMPIFPHPFLNPDLTGKTVVLLDPVSDLTWHLAEMHEQGESPNELLHEDYIRIDNTALNRAGPPGVMVVAANWRNTQ